MLLGAKDNGQLGLSSSLTPNDDGNLYVWNINDYGKGHPVAFYLIWLVLR